MKFDEELYKEIAQKYNISVDEVKREMQKAIDLAFVFPEKSADEIPREGVTPTIEEFLAYAVKQIHNN